MPQIKLPAWVNPLKNWLNNTPLGVFFAASITLGVFCLFCYCLSQPVNSEKIPPTIASQPVYDHFCRCGCCKASGVSAFFINLPHFMPNQPNSPHRLVIYASDIRQLTGCSKSTSQRQLSNIKIKLGKESHQYVTIEEYCNDMGLNYEKTLQQLKLK